MSTQSFSHNSSATKPIKLQSYYQSLPAILWSPLNIQPVTQPKLVLFNESLAYHELALPIDSKLVTEAQLAEYFSGNTLLPGSKPIAQAYAGHQFGNFTVLGDGRAALLGEAVDAQGNLVDVQLKGSGPTAYSRGGDGRAAIGPMLREYILCEAMYALNLPTSRALAVVTTGETVYRTENLAGAILTRVAASHVRVGSFEYLLAYKDTNALKALADYVIQRHYPLLNNSQPNNSQPNAQPNKQYLHLLQSVIQSQAELIAQWMAIGFVHGVMNTDNMTISGETIDYGPCAFMDEYQADFVLSAIDRRGRYAYKNQPVIAQWNLARLAEALLPLIAEESDISSAEAVVMAKEALGEFDTLYQNHWLRLFRKKLGLLSEELNDQALIQQLLDCMATNIMDFTNTFRSLSAENILNHDPEAINVLSAKIPSPASFLGWLEQWQDRLKQDNDNILATDENICKESLVQQRVQLMQRVNPIIIPRNHLIEQALQAVIQDNNFDLVKELITALQQPFTHSEHSTHLYQPPTESERVKQTFCGT